jgi:hypothetical protein
MYVPNFAFPPTGPPDPEELDPEPDDVDPPELEPEDDAPLPLDEEPSGDVLEEPPHAAATAAKRRTLGRG